MTDDKTPILAAKVERRRKALMRRRLNGFLILLLTGGALLVCVLFLSPFVSAMTWAVSLAVIGYPLHQWLLSRLERPDLAAFCAVLIVALVILVPVLVVLQQVAQQALSEKERLAELLEGGAWRTQLTSIPTIGPLANDVLRAIDTKKALSEFGEATRRNLGPWVQATVWTGMQLLITLFLLFYLFRDKKVAVDGLRKYSPFSTREANEIFKHVLSMLHATLYGTLTVSLIQGALGGLAFWLLGIPAPFLWGAAMFIASLVPVLGSFVVWAPASIGLMLQGQWGKGVGLVVWGVLVVSMIDNLLYPFLVGQNVKIHTAAVFLAMTGGLIVFGVSGLILGPLALSLSIALIKILLRRTSRQNVMMPVH